MVDYRCEIEYLPKGNGNINSVNLPIGNNISLFNGGQYSNSSIELPKNGSNPFILGVNTIGDGSQYTEKYEGYMSKQLSDENGNCDFEITIAGEDIDNFIIHFDNVVNQYATEIQIDNETFTNDDTFFVAYIDKKTTHTVKFTKWSKPNSNIRFTAITIGLTLTYNQFNGLSYFVRGSQNMQDNSSPSYGAISQYGNVVISDFAGEISEMEQINVLKSGIKIKLYLDDNLVGEYIFDTFEKENDTTYNIQLTDKIYKWNDMNVNTEYYQENKTAYDLYLFLKSQDTNVEYEELTEETINFLQSISIKYMYFDESSLFTNWNKFGSITQMRICQNEIGKVCIRRLQ